MSVLDWARGTVGNARYQCLESILNLRPASNTLRDYVLNWTFLPLEFNKFADTMVNAPPKYPTTESYKAVGEFTRRHDGQVTFDSTWLQEDLDYLETLLLAKSASEKVQTAFNDLDATQELYRMNIAEESQAAGFIEAQIKDFLRPVIRSAFDGNLSLYIRMQPRSRGSGHSTVIADAEILLGDDSPADETDKDLVKGEYKVPRVLTPRVLRWIIWLASRSYALDENQREGACAAEQVACRILNQVSRSDL
jgi:hypothetical protein